MKLFPVVAALALVGAIGQISNADSISDPLSGSMTVDDFLSSLVEDVESSSASASMAGSASGSMEFESFEDLRSRFIDQIKAWSDNVTMAMIDWAGSSSEEYKELKKKLKATELLVAKAKKLPNLDSSVGPLELIGAEFVKKAEQVNAFMNSTIDSLFEYLEMAAKYSMFGSAPDTTSTEGSDEGSIMQTGVDSATQSSPSFQKTWEKLTGSAPATQSTK